MPTTPRTYTNPSTPTSTRRRSMQAVLTMCLSVVLSSLVPATFAAPSQSSVATAGSSDARLVKWNPKREGFVSLTDVQDKRKIPGAPQKFRDKLQRQLRSIWRDELGGAPECRLVAGIQVWALRSDGYALGNVVSGVGDTGCAAGASGAVIFWAKKNGTWRRAIETADIVTCTALQRITFPSELGIRKCFNGTDVVRYYQD